MEWNAERKRNDLKKGLEEYKTKSTPDPEAGRYKIKMYDKYVYIDIPSS